MEVSEKCKNFGKNSYVAGGSGVLYHLSVPIFSTDLLTQLNHIQTFNLTQPLRSYINRNFGTRILSKWIVLCFDIVITIFSYGVAYILRFNFNTASISFGHFIQDTLLTAGIFTISFLLFKSYDGIIRHSGIADIARLIKSGLFALFICLGLSILTRYVGNEVAILPASIAIIHVVLNISALTISRYIIKVLFYSSSKNKNKPVTVVIYGAGRRGISVLHALREDVKTNYQILGFLDDNLSKIDKTIEGIKIYPGNAFLDLYNKNRIDELIISIQDLENARKNDLVDTCLNNHIAVKYTPPVDDWINGKLSTNQIRYIHIEELLGRDPIKIENEKVFHELTNKVILITGAAGSIGSEIVRQVIHYKPSQLILLDQAESGLYDLNMDLFFKLNQLNENAVEFIIADVTNLERLTYIFKKYKPQLVFHAAAYKHVPLMESNPAEAVHVNIFGSKNLIDLSIEYQVEKFVMISTDKAVHPVNVMGATKRVAEIYAHNKSKMSDCKTTFITTRFGNVLGSNGSVVIYFKKQIDNGGPITITHPDVTRYFMTISEACQLVLEAVTMGRASEIYLFDMGQPVKIIDLARKMVLLSGLTPGSDIQFVFTGLRPGEKLHEILLGDGENIVPTHHDKIKIARTAEFDPKWVDDSMNQLWDALMKSDQPALLVCLKGIIPDLNLTNNSNDLNLQPDTPFHVSFD